MSGRFRAGRATGEGRVAVTGRRWVVPSAGLPPGLEVLRANNNLDVAHHDGHLFLAWRTARRHFADPQARIHVVRSDDGGRRWRHETTLAFGRDVREPRLVTWHGDLHCYCFTAGRNPWRFEPDRVHLAVRDRNGRWSEPVPVSEPDTVVWRVRPFQGRLLMSTYRNAGTLFTRHPRPLQVELRVSDDGQTWAPLDPQHPVSHLGGAEAEILPLADGRLLAVVRKEGPDGGWGSDLCVADADRPARWDRRRALPQKLDSPLLFDHDGVPLLVARRSTAFGGRYDLRWRAGSPVLRTRCYQAVWWLTPKRSTLWHVDPDELTLTPLADLGGVGDTAFGAEVPLGGGRHLVFDYTSPPRPRWRPWLAGMLGPSRVYAVEVDASALTHTDVAHRPGTTR